MKVYLNENIMEAAHRRVAYVFDEFEDIFVMFSGGKDSTVVLELAYREAKLRDRLPLKVIWVDQEAEWQGTVNYMHRVASRPGIDMIWVQVPFEMDNTSSVIDDCFKVFDPENEALWVHPAVEGAVKTVSDSIKTKKKYEDFYTLLDLVRNDYTDREDKRHAALTGMRVEESPNRSRALSTRLNYKHISWAARIPDAEDSWRFAPIFDWKTKDVWTATARETWDYNDVYDKQFQIGISPLRMRVSSLTHGIAAKNILKMVQELEPETYERLVMRLPGVDTTSKLEESMFMKNLPSMFVSWQEYCEYLLDYLVNEISREGFYKVLRDKQTMVVEWDSTFWKMFAQLILNNDYYSVGMCNYLSVIARKKYIKERRFAK